MGAGASSMAGSEGWGQTSLGDMPESCVAPVLLYLDPPEICLVARLNRAFRGAASADCVWATKLPANYRYLAALAAAADDDSSSDGSIEGNGRCCSSSATKKEKYARLCRPTPSKGAPRNFGSRRARVVFACPSPQRLWRLPVLMIGGIGATSPQTSQDSIVLPTFSKYGGWRWLGRLISASLLVHIAFSSGSTWAGHTSEWAVGSMTLSSSTVGTLNQHGFSSQLQMASTQHPTII